MSSEIMRWGRYARVSTQEQSGPDTSSIEDQLKSGERIIGREGGSHVDDYIDDKAYRDARGRKVEPSGERADRPEFQRLLADIRSGRINAVAVFHEWRIYRDYPPFTEFIMAVRGRAVTVRLAHGQWVEQFAVFGAWMGKTDNDHRKLQTFKGMWSKAETGFSPTAIPRFYRSARDEKGKRVSVELRAEFRPWLDELARLFLTGLPYAQIAHELGRNPATGRALNKSSVVDLLGSAFLQGLIVAGKDSTTGERFTVKGTHPAAWSPETVTAIRLELARRGALGHSVPHTRKYLFSGLLRCGYCGAIMTGHERPHPWRVNYSCQRRLRGIYKPDHAPNNIGEKQVLLLLDELGQHVTGASASEWVTNFGARQPRAAGKLDAEVSRLRDDLADVEGELAALPASAKRSVARLTEDRERLLARLAAAEIQTPLTAAPMAEAQAQVDAILNLYQGSSLLERHRKDPNLRAEIMAAYPVLYLKHGQLVPPPADM